MDIIFIIVLIILGITTGVQITTLIDVYNKYASSDDMVHVDKRRFANRTLAIMLFYWGVVGAAVSCIWILLVVVGPNIEVTMNDTVVAVEQPPSSVPTSDTNMVIVRTTHEIQTCVIQLHVYYEYLIIPGSTNTAIIQSPCDSTMDIAHVPAFRLVLKTNGWSPTVSESAVDL